MPSLRFKGKPVTQNLRRTLACRLLSPRFTRILRRFMQPIALGFHDVTDPTRVEQSPISSTRRHYALDRRDFQSHMRAISNATVNVAHIAHPAFWGDQPVFLTFDDG